MQDQEESELLVVDDVVVVASEKVQVQEGDSDGEERRVEHTGADVGDGDAVGAGDSEGEGGVGEEAGGDSVGDQQPSSFFFW